MLQSRCDLLHNCFDCIERRQEGRKTGARVPRGQARGSRWCWSSICFQLIFNLSPTYGQQATRIIYYLRLSVIILDAYFGIDRMAKEEE